ncbi:GIY-YIG nuclease family protein [Streptomyces sp. NPDC014801]|uniref:GIY-YIG nuclease family protein n=1 Tax=Streptomyces sp. NPDC014801 TaxID=3364916 RepID=UPI0036FB0938
MTQPRRPRASVRDPFRTKQSTNAGRRLPHADKVPPDDPNRTDILITIHRFELAGIEIDERAVEIATAFTRWYHANAEERERVHAAEMAARQAAAAERECWVYYVRCGRLIKIGMTTNLANRFGSIRPNEVLAIEPGGAELERALHKQFAALRAGGEYFHPGAALQKHVREVRAVLGPPNWTRSIVPDGDDWFPAESL